jgi:hypothetical protein
MVTLQHHYTDKAGFNGIRSAKIWRFLASKPPCDHPKGVYFTDLDEQTPRLAQRLRIPRAKLEYVFTFRDAGDLTRLEGGLGRNIFYVTTDYEVDEERQTRHGEARQ